MTHTEPEKPGHDTWWAVYRKILIEILVGVFVFVIVGSASVGLNVLVRNLEVMGVDAVILYGLVIARYALFASNLASFIRFLWRTIFHPKMETAEHGPWWKVPWEFLFETLGGVFVFVMVGSASVGLNLLVHTLEVVQVDVVILYGLISAEYALFLVDLTCFGRSLWKTTSRAWREP